jgi:hypothetical protein
VKTRTPAPHLLQTTDPDRGDPHMPRSCEVCGLPETRTDVHPATLPATPAEVVEREARLLGEGGDR